MLRIDLVRMRQDLAPQELFLMGCQARQERGRILFNTVRNVTDVVAAGVEGWEIVFDTVVIVRCD